MLQYSTKVRFFFSIIVIVFWFFWKDGFNHESFGFYILYTFLFTAYWENKIVVSVTPFFKIFYGDYQVAKKARLSFVSYKEWKNAELRSFDDLFSLKSWQQLKYLTNNLMSIFRMFMFYLVRHVSANNSAFRIYQFCPFFKKKLEIFNRD